MGRGRRGSAAANLQRLLVFSKGVFIIILKCERNFPNESFPRILFKSPLGIIFKQESVYVEKEKLAAFK